MSSSFKTAVKNTPVDSLTANGAATYQSSTSPCVDLFFLIGSARNADVLPVFEAAYQENPDVAIRILLWSRDVRGGAGERETPRKVLRYMEKIHPDHMKHIILSWSEFGRWDDLLIFEEAETKEFAFEVIRHALKAGVKAKNYLETIDDMTDKDVNRILNDIENDSF
jgi:hypothetical protein